MKITILMPHMKIAGGVRLVLSYAHFLEKMGHSVVVVLENKIWWRRTLANLLQVKPSWNIELEARVKKVKDLKDDKNIPGADIIVACDWSTGAKMNKYSEKKGVKFQLLGHDERLYHGKWDEVEKTFTHPTKKIVISSWIHDRLKNDLNVESDILLTPVDYETFHPVKTEKNKDEIRILMLHHTYKWKGVNEGLEAVKKIKDKHPNLKLIMFGARSKIIDLPCDEYYFKPQKKLAWLYSSCDIYLCPSWYEGLGMPAMEAMACGSAVVTFDTGGSRDYAFDRKTAFVAKHRDVDDLTSKLMLAVENDELRKKIAAEGRRFICNDIDTWEESAKKMETIFLNAINEEKS